ncbi:TPA: hypothetical protein HA244_04730 [Candidatus Micrarchaeota archaeon]|nr:hypothetical protein [Candidatus Micrarchaeota archaeon]
MKRLFLGFSLLALLVLTGFSFAETQGSSGNGPILYNEVRNGIKYDVQVDYFIQGKTAEGKELALALMRSTKTDLATGQISSGKPFLFVRYDVIASSGTTIAPTIRPAYRAISGGMSYSQRKTFSNSIPLEVSFNDNNDCGYHVCANNFEGVLVIRPNRSGDPRFGNTLSGSKFALLPMRDWYPVSAQYDDFCIEKKIMPEGIVADDAKLAEFMSELMEKYSGTAEEKEEQAKPEFNSRVVCTKEEEKLVYQVESRADASICYATVGMGNHTRIMKGSTPVDVFERYVMQPKQNYDCKFLGFDTIDYEFGFNSLPATTSALLEQISGTVIAPRVG